MEKELYTQYETNPTTTILIIIIIFVFPLMGYNIYSEKEKKSKMVYINKLQSECINNLKNYIKNDNKNTHIYICDKFPTLKQCACSDLQVREEKE